MAREIHKYSTGALITILFILGIGSILATNTHELDAYFCNENNSTLKRINGEWQCNTIYYAEGYIYNESGQIININTANTYYNITGWQEGHTKEIIFWQNGINITKTGMYKIDGSISFTGGNGGLYEMEVFINNIGDNHCTFFRSTSTTAKGNAGIACLTQLTKGDHITFQIEDQNNPSQNIQIYSANINIIEI